MIKLHDIEFSYSRAESPSLQGVTADIGTGIYLLTGENGAGKTTLLHLLAGLSLPSKGECKIDGTDCSSDDPSEMGKVFLLEENAVFPGKTIRHFAQMHSRFYPSFSLELFISNLKEFGMDGFEPLKSLSPGNRKKAQLAYVLALGIKVLLLDEPTNGLDIISKDKLRKIIISSLDEGQTIVVATHNVNEFENIFDGIIVLNKSRLIFMGTADELTEKITFRVTPYPIEFAIYSEIQAGRVHSICPIDESGPSSIDWRLLYCALHSPQRNDILNLLNSHEQHK